MSVVRDPAQVFCSCGEPIELWNVPDGHTALPVEWFENGCIKCKQKMDDRSNKK